MRPALLLAFGAACLATFEEPTESTARGDRSERPAQGRPSDRLLPIADTLPPSPTVLACLRAGYGSFIEVVEADTRGTWIVMKGAKRILWEDGRDKSFEEKLDTPDLEDQFEMTYPKGPMIEPPAPNDDPGRIRHARFLKAVYGEDARAVRANLTEVPWLPARRGIKLRFNRMNGAADALERVSAGLAALPRPLTKYVARTAGTFNRRNIAGTNRPSAHGLGIAIDINPNFGDYWRWHPLTPSLAHKNRIPFEIVEVFENNGFIWGGKWYHFDTLHFEYRPELLSPQCVR